jgi:ABC-2 type transport system ATP-binding protein
MSEKLRIPESAADSAAAPPRLEVRGLSKSFRGVVALGGVDLRVEAGERVVLLGPNGAGKTTLFQLLTGLYHPDGGTVRIVGQDLAEDPCACLAAVGVVFQQPTLDLDLDPAANLRFHARLHGLVPRRRREARIAAALAALGIADLAGRPCRELSGGIRRRVELARALLPEPPLLLLDEPTVGLDPASRRDLLARIRTLAAEGGTGVLWATHLVDEAEDADRVLVLHRGRRVAEGPPARVAEGAGSLAAAFLALTARGADSAAAPGATARPAG